MSKRAQIIFDWNSTLLDDFHIVHECMNRVMAHAGKPAVSMEDFRASYEVPFEMLYLNLGFAESEVEKMMEHDRHVFHNHYEPRAENAGLRDGAADILQHVKDNGLQSYILSNHIVEPIRNQLRRLSIEHFFTEVLAYATHATQFKDMSKGERLRRYRVDHGQTDHPAIIVGDSIEEIQIAREQGLISVAITGGGALEKRLRDERPDYVIHSLHELKPILAERGFVS